MTSNAPGVTGRARRAVRLHDDPRAAAAAAGLAHVSADTPGFTRVRCGRGFSYHDSHGRLVDARQRRRIAALAIPPAWTDVWICALENGHLQCTGFDGKGRKQYLYHERWRVLRDAAGFDRLSIMGEALPAIRDHIAAQLRRRSLDRTRILAAMVRLLDRSGIRVGGEAYERDNSSIGLTTLRWSHVRLTQAAVSLRFPAKSGIRAEVEVADRPLARLLMQLKAGGRQRVFRSDGVVLRATDLNAYLAEVAGVHVTAKDFRTWRGTVAALGYLAALPTRRRGDRDSVTGAIDAAACALRNTRAVARAHYVHPGLFEAWRNEDIKDLWRLPAVEGLSRDETMLVALLPRMAIRGGS